MVVVAMLPEQMVRLHEVVARVQVAVVLQGQGVTARLPEDAQRRGEAAPRGQGCVEELHEDRAHIVDDPLVEDRGEEVSPGARVHRAVGDRVPLLEARLVLPFHDGDELDEGESEDVPEVAVDLGRVILVGGMHGAQHVDVDPVRLESGETPEHPLRRRPAPLVHPIAIVQVRRAVDADPDEESVTAKSSHHSSVSSVPLVWIVCRSF